MASLAIYHQPLLAPKLGRATLSQKHRVLLRNDARLAEGLEELLQAQTQCVKRALDIVSALNQ